MTYDLPSLTEFATLQRLLDTQGLDALLATLDATLASLPPDSRVTLQEGPQVGPRTLRVLARALRVDADFLRAHPESLFQCLYNRLRWHDAPDAATHFLPDSRGAWSAPDAHLFALAAHWRKQREATGGPAWLESLRPLRGPLEGPDQLLWHKAQVLCAAFDPSGTRLATGTWEDGHNVHVWDVATGRHLQVMEGHEAEIRGLAWSADGTQLASGSRDHEARIWDVETGELVHAMAGQEGQVTSVAFSPDGRLLAAANLGWRVRLFDVDTGQVVRTLKGHQQSVLSVSFHPSGRWLATGASDQTVRVWDVETGTQQASLPVDTHVEFVEFSPNGEWLAWTTSEGLRVAETRDWTLPPRTVGQGPYSQVGWLGTSRLGALSYARVEVLDAQEGNLLWSRAYVSDGHQRGVAFSSDLKHFALTASDGGALLSELYAAPPPTPAHEQQRVRNLWGHAGGAVAIARNFEGSVAIEAHGAIRDFPVDSAEAPTQPWHDSPDGALLAYPILETHHHPETYETTREPGVQLLDVKSLTPVRRLLAPALGGAKASASFFDAMPVAFSPDGQLLAAAIEHGAVRVWRVADGSLLHTLRGPGGPVTLVEFTRDGAHVVSGHTEASRLLLHEVKGGSLVLNARALMKPAPSYALATNAPCLAVGRASGELELFDVPQGSRRNIQVSNQPIVAVGLSEDGSLVAACALEEPVRVFDARTGTLLYSLPHPAFTYAVALRDDVLVTLSDDSTLRFFDLATGSPRTEVHGSASLDDVTDQPLWEALGTGPVSFHSRLEPAPLAHFHDALEEVVILRDGCIVGRGRDARDVLFVLRFHAPSNPA